MNRIDWIQSGAFFCVFALYLGLAAAFLIDGMEWAAIVGTLPSWAYVIAVRIAPSKAPQADQTKDWFV